MKPPKVLIDKDGNVLTYHYDTKQVYLRLKNGRNINIGRFEDGKLYVKRDPVKHGFSADHSIGFNYQLLNEGTFQEIVVYYGTDTLCISRKLAIQKGEVRNFKKKGYELQIFVPLTAFLKTE